MVVKRKENKGKKADTQSRSRHIDGIRLNKPKPNFYWQKKGTTKRGAEMDTTNQVGATALNKVYPSTSNSFDALNTMDIRDDSRSSSSRGNQEEKIGLSFLCVCLEIGNKLPKGVSVSKGFQVGKDFAFKPKASNVGSNGDNGTRVETNTRASPSNNMNEGVSLNTMGTNAKQQDTGKKTTNIASPNPFAALGVGQALMLKRFPMFSVASWNIKGLNRTPKQKEVCQVVNKNNLSVCTILESHVDVAAVYDTCENVCSRSCMCSNLIGHARLMRNRPWVLLGDFNAALNLEDHSAGGYEPNATMYEFKECVQAIEVAEVNSTSLHFTWNQKPKGSNGILKKIDRIIGNLQFIDDFPGSFAIFQPYRISDHSPCVLRIPTSVNLEGCAMFRVVKRLKGLESPFHKLLHNHGNLHERAGNSTTAYFHKLVKSKCARKKIEMVSDASNNLYDGNQVPGAFVNHYNQFLGAEGVTIPLDDHDLFTLVLDDAKADFMVREVSNDEVKSPILSIGVIGLLDLTVSLLLSLRKHGMWWVAISLALFGIFSLMCISKIISYRVKEGLGDIICINQSAFVPSRRISDNILLTQELMRNYHRRCGPPRCAFTVDIQKAYDTRRMRDSDDFQCHHLCQQQRIINLCFVDDLFLFSHGNPSLVTIIMDALEEFKQVSGLVPSISKSMTFFCNVLNAIKASILNSMPFIEGVLPVSSSLRNKFLSLVGRLQLIWSVLSSMHIYWASVFILPNRIVHELEQLMRGFLWCQGEMKKGKAKVAWDFDCMPKHEGGLEVMLVGDGASLSKSDPQSDPFWHKINNCKSTSAWFDRWADLCPLKDMFSNRDIARSGFYLDDSVPLLLDDIDDVILWRDRDGDLRPFSVACAWDTIRARADIVNWYNVVWSKVRVLCGIDSIPPWLIDVTSFINPISKGKTEVNILSRLVLAATS
ncbi:sodium/hydrogen exchanger 6 [Tanacetum coccineum]|uniref:Sodium/hydrogen exchanger 6 n=1 Tax=Tanacetum coccineum TaxID=301880 RepID=A0ABQ5FGU2_9ASTR